MYIGGGGENFITNHSISTSPVSLKLLIDKKHKKVLFSEDGKDFVDFLFTILSLPFNTVIGLLFGKRMIGCLGKLYGSLENLNDTYLQPNLNKDPSSYSYSGEVCYMADDLKALCLKCHNFISKPTTYVARSAVAASGKGGRFVREAVTYMITDDMEVKPMSAISSIALLKNFDVKDVRLLEEIVVPLDKDNGACNLRPFHLILFHLLHLNMFLLAEVLFAEASKEVVDFLFTLLSLHVATVTRLLLSNGGMGLKLVKASFESKTALTNVFLGLLVPIPLVTASMATNTVSLKLLIDTKGHKVLFAEAGKDFVDFVFTLLALPVGTVIRLLSKDNMVGSLGKLYDSRELLNDTYMLPNLNRDTLLKPKAPIGGANVPHLLTNDESLAKKVSMCGSYHRFIADDPRAICPQCKYILSTVPYVAAQAITEGSSGGGAGYERCCYIHDNG
ncbi:unnamed protein product [Prunus brigantina]